MNQSELMYIEADKYLKELKDHQKKSFSCRKRFQYSAKKALKRRVAWGPDAVCLIHEMTREYVDPKAIWVKGHNVL